MNPSQIETLETILRETKKQTLKLSTIKNKFKEAGVAFSTATSEFLKCPSFNEKLQLAGDPSWIAGDQITNHFFQRAGKKSAEARPPVAEPEETKLQALASLQLDDGQPQPIQEPEEFDFASFRQLVGDDPEMRDCISRALALVGRSLLAAANQGITPDASKLEILNFEGAQLSDGVVVYIVRVALGIAVANFCPPEKLKIAFESNLAKCLARLVPHVPLQDEFLPISEPIARYDAAFSQSLSFLSRPQ